MAALVGVVVMLVSRGEEAATKPVPLAPPPLPVVTTPAAAPRAAPTAPDRRDAAVAKKLFEEATRFAGERPEEYQQILTKLTAARDQSAEGNHDGRRGCSLSLPGTAILSRGIPISFIIILACLAILISMGDSAIILWPSARHEAVNVL